MNYDRILSILSIIVAGIAIWQAISAALKGERIKGAHERDYEQVKKDLEHAFEKIAILQSESQDGKLTLVKIEEQLSHLIKSVDEMSAKLDRHIETESQRRQ